MKEPAQLEQLAGGLEHPTQLLYFTTPSVTADGRTLVVVRDEAGNPNLHAMDLDSGESRRLTDQRDGILKSYVYFRGQPNRGFGKASVSLDPVQGRVYWIQGTEIRRVDLAGRERVLARLPDDQVTAFMHVSADGRRLCVPTTDARALAEDAPAAPRFGENTVAGRRNEVITDKPDYDIDERVRREDLSSWLRVFDTETGELVACERVRRGWVTHVQFSPVRSDWILYNHEWPSDCGVRRLWLWDGREHRPLRAEGAGRSRADWVCHEMWEADGGGIIYHGKFADGVAFIGRVGPAGGDNVEIALPREYTRYGHFTAGTRHINWLVSDGYWHPTGEPEDGRWGGEWLTRLQVDWACGRIEWTPLCRHHSAWDCQDSHPHPVFGPGDRKIYFTSNLGGGRSVCRVALP
ncbi:MAG TPA: oligogalacturonate lyase family protein [Lacunisphaera sp.]|nr:oligogalacturonate lyase family protein [Lacunisphaera sp.]